MDKLSFHLFICTNQKEKGECCGAKGSVELRRHLKDLVKRNPTWRPKAKVSSSGCLGYCEQGIAGVLYPEGRWFTNIEAKDREFFEGLIKSVLDED